MELREYKSTDCEQMAQLFYNTVHSVNVKDYTEEQLNAWATGSVDLQEWNHSFLNHKTVVAVEDDEIVGFGDIDQSGYLARLYVHINYQGMGITLKNYVMEKKTFIGFSDKSSVGSDKGISIQKFRQTLNESEC